MLHFLAFSLNGKIYINASLTFGVASSYLIFECVTGTLQWIVINETRCHWISHFLDDFPFLECSCQDLKQFMKNFYSIMQHIGMPIAVRKTLGPTQILEYLGLILNFKAQTMGILEKK